MPQTDTKRNPPHTLHGSRSISPIYSPLPLHSVQGNNSSRESHTTDSGKTPLPDNLRSQSSAYKSGGEFMPLSNRRIATTGNSPPYPVPGTFSKCADHWPPSGLNLTTIGETVDWEIGADSIRRILANDPQSVESQFDLRALPTRLDLNHVRFWKPR